MEETKKPKIYYGECARRCARRYYEGNGEQVRVRQLINRINSGHMVKDTTLLRYGLNPDDPNIIPPEQVKRMT
jgi:hypothetical protein